MKDAKEKSTLRVLRDGKRLTQAEVGDVVGVSFSAVKNWECGHCRTITKEQAEKYAEALGVPVMLIEKELRIKEKGERKKPEPKQISVEDVLKNTPPEDADPDFMKKLKDGLKAEDPSSGKARENGWRRTEEEMPKGRCFIMDKGGTITMMDYTDIVWWMPIPEVPHE